MTPPAIRASMDRETPNEGGSTPTLLLPSLLRLETQPSPQRLARNRLPKRAPRFDEQTHPTAAHEADQHRTWLSTPAALQLDSGEATIES